MCAPFLAASVDSSRLVWEAATCRLAACAENGHDMHPRSLPLAIVLLSFATAACDDGKKADPKTSDTKTSDTKTSDTKTSDARTPEAKTAAADPAATPTLAVHMQEHFAQATAVRDALIAGSIEGTTEPAKWLAEHSTYETMPETWKAHVQDMKNAGQLVVEGTDLASKANAAAQLATACAGCHTALGAKPTWKTPLSEDVDESGPAAHMAKHLMATDQLWQGLAGPSDEAWRAGVLALADAPLVPEGLAGESTAGTAVAALADKVHEIGKRGGEASDPAARAVVYGELLATCAPCHQATKPGG
jgi:hypothetical protein